MMVGGRQSAGHGGPRSWELQCCFEQAHQIRLSPLRPSRATACRVRTREGMMLEEDIQVEEIIARVAAVDIGKAELV